KLSYVEPHGERMTLNALAEKLEHAHPGRKAVGFFLPSRDDLALNVTLGGGGKTAMFAVNPYTGAELGPLDGANPLMKKMHQFHTNLLLGANGKTITMVAAVFLVGLSLSGIVLWWPRKIWRPSLDASGKKRNFDLHNALGIWAAGFMLLFGITGIVIHWDNEARALVNRLAGASEPPPIPKKLSLPPRGAKPLEPDTLFSIATQAVPGAKVTALMGLGSPGSPVRITMRFPEDRTPGRTNLYVDGFTGKVVSALDSRTAPIGFRVAKLWNREVHTGDIAGWPTRILACAASFSLPLLAITGPLIWWGRIRRKRNPQSADNSLDTENNHEKTN
ncbi:MAG: PepSY-associated TM helix domain-containing protein, partial [Chthoniobacteraceae bacterium]